MRCLLLFALTAAAAAQSLADPSRAASLASTFDSPSATDFRCEVKPIAPQLNFGLRFQAGYVVVFPMRQFTGAGHHLDVTLRVTPDGAPPSYLTQALDLPEVPQATKADGVLAGSILVGEGSYRIDALIEDDQQRVCRADWRMRARQERAERDLTPLMPPNAVASLLSTIPAAPRTGDVRTIGRLTVLLHAAPLRARNAVLQSGDVQMLTGSLAALLERLPARSVRVVAFNLDQQKELLRRDNFAASDIESVTRAVNDLQLATIDYSVLSDPSGGVAMLASMVDAELRDADTVIVLGPEGRVRVPLPASLPERPSTSRLFYFDYQRRTGFASSPLPPISPNGRGGPGGRGGAGRAGRGGGPGGRGPGPRGAPPSDTIRQLVKRLKGIVLDVRAPADFARAVRRVNR